MSDNLLRDIAELRRNMPHNRTAMRVCDALEERLAQSGQVVNLTSKVNSPQYPRCEASKVYMRGYMKNRRAAEKANAQA